MKKDWKYYCETAYNALKANVHNWGKPEFSRPITRIYYISVFDCGNPNPTGLISENALQHKENKKKVVIDHCLSPQFIGRMILDNPDIYLNNFEKFRNSFWYSTRTIVVTQQENDALSELTDNDGINYQVKVPTNLKYNHLGIQLHQRHENRTMWKRKFCDPMDTNILDVPEELLKYEQRFLVS